MAFHRVAAGRTSPCLTPLRSHSRIQLLTQSIAIGLWCHPTRRPMCPHSARHIRPTEAERWNQPILQAAVLRRLCRTAACPSRHKIHRSALSKKRDLRCRSVSKRVKASVEQVKYQKIFNFHNTQLILQWILICRTSFCRISTKTPEFWIQLSPLNWLCWNVTLWPQLARVYLEDTGQRIQRGQINHALGLCCSQWKKSGSKGNTICKEADRSWHLTKHTSNHVTSTLDYLKRI